MEEAEVPTEHLHEEIHHLAEHGGDRWIFGVALSSALLATFAAIASMSSGHYSTEAMVSQIESANQWSYFQSKSIKEAQLRGKIELLEALGKPSNSSDQAKIADYQKEKSEIEHKAGELAQESKHFLHTHHLLARCVTMFQIGIAVGAISALTRRKLFWWVSLAFGVGGIVLAVMALLSM